MSSRSESLWKRIGEESPWGRRGIIKVNLLWLSLAVLLYQKSSESWRGSAVSSLQVFLTAAFWLSASILANNLGDCADDRATGKPRWVCDLSLGAGATVVLFLIGTGFAVLFFSKSPPEAKWAYMGATVLGLAYSLKPLRLKERGAWGILVYSLACTCAYVVLPWSWLKGKWAALFLLGPAVLLDKWVNLHFHQVVDYEADQTRGVQTLALRMGVNRARLLLKIFAGLASLWLLLALVYGISFLPKLMGYVYLGGSAVILAAAVLATFARAPLSSLSIFRRELPAYYLATTYIVFRLLPLLLFFMLARQEKSLWPVFGVSLTLVLLETWNLRRPLIS
jgi:4-hydroxybenzoate polyprenyltransferase